MKSKPYLFSYSRISETFGVGWGFDYKVIDACRVNVRKESTWEWWLFAAKLFFGLSPTLQSVRPKTPRSTTAPSMPILDQNELTEDEELPQAFWDKQRANQKLRKKHEASSK